MTPKDLHFICWGGAFSRVRNFPKALAALETAVEKNPGDVNVYRELGYACEVSKHYPKALDAYLEGLTLAPEDSDFKQSVERMRRFAHLEHRIG